MKVQVLFFGMLRDLVGASNEEAELAEEARVDAVLARYASRSEGLAQLLPSVAVAVNQEFAQRDRILHEGDEIALLPPVSGGAPRAAIVREKIDAVAVLERVKHASDGAAVVFDGVVRNHTRGRRTLYLDYEAYEAMALKQMEQLAAQALQRFAVREVAMVHRLGRLEVGETSVLIVVSSAHRAAAFEACRWLIDLLKQTVPIWKKEHFEDGAVWADGEPFPAEALRPELQ